MIKLYRFSEKKKEYWEAWDNGNGSHTVHWGALGTRGHSKTIRSTRLTRAMDTIQQEIDIRVAHGFRTIDLQEHFVLSIEYSIGAMGSEQDLEKRYRLEDRLHETLRWTGLGVCDGGSIGSGTMEICCLVVDFDLARDVIERVLAGTEFENYTSFSIKAINAMTD